MVQTARSIKTGLDEFCVDELEWPTQSSDLSHVKPLWDELTEIAGQASPTSVSHLTKYSSR